MAKGGFAIAITNDSLSHVSIRGDAIILEGVVISKPNVFHTNNGVLLSLSHIKWDMFEVLMQLR